MIGQTPVLLDLAENRYFLLRGELARAFLDYLAGDSGSRVLRPLSEAKLLCDSRHVQSRKTCPAAASSHCDTPAGPIGVRLLTQAASHRLAARRAVRAVPFPGLGALAHKARAARGASIGAGEPAIADAHRKACRFLASEGQCLPHSLAVMRTLALHGHDPALLIGVQLPFAAHCWVQCGDRVVNDTLERVRSFTPLAVL